MSQLTLFNIKEKAPVAVKRRSEVFNDYEGFVAKFDAVKTTDDCYTPSVVYDEVLAFVRETWNIDDGVPIDRPFYPGGDYLNYHYADGGIVVDNPPFSLLSRIIRFYCAEDVPFFLFAPSLTLFSAAAVCDVTYIVTSSEIIYENGARVRTGFVTNLQCDSRIWVCPSLKERLDKVQLVMSKKKKQFVYPDNIVTAATLQKLAAHGVEFRVAKNACAYIGESDGCKAVGRSLFGGGFLLSTEAAAERAAAERAAADVIELSAREKNIILELDKKK